MKLCFKLDSIIRFTLLGCGTPIVHIGKVIDVTPDSVKILPQLKVYGGNTWESVAKSFRHEESYFKNYICTADSKDPIYLRRSLIMSWEYAHPTDENITKTLGKTLSDYYRFNNEEYRGKYTINQYKDGIFIGDGPDCSWMEESPSLEVLASILKEHMSDEN